MSGYHNVQVNDPRTAALPLALGGPPQLADSPGPRYHVSGVGMANQIKGHAFDAVRSDQLRRLGLELRQLQDRDFQRIAHYSEVYRSAV